MLRLKFRRKGKLSSSSFICIPWQQLRIVVRSSFRTSTRPFASILRWLFSIIYCLLQNLLFAGLKQRVSTFNFSAMFHYLLCFTSVTTFISFECSKCGTLSIIHHKPTALMLISLYSRLYRSAMLVNKDGASKSPTRAAPAPPRPTTRQVPNHQRVLTPTTTACGPAASATPLIVNEVPT